MRSLSGMNIRSALLTCLVLALMAALPFSSAFAAEGKGDGQTASSSDSGEDVEVVRASRLEDRIPPVSGRLFFKKHRFEVTPSVNISFGDAFFQKVGIGLKLDYHIFETFSVTGHVIYNFNTTSHSVRVCGDDGSCEKPETDDLTNVPGKLGLVAGLGLSWTPIYGKLSVMAEHVLHFDFGITGGVDGIQYMAPLSSEYGGDNKFTVGGHVGMLFRVTFNDWMALRFELRDYIYSGATVKLGESTSKVENQIMFEIGLSFFFGAGSED